MGKMHSNLFTILLRTIFKYSLLNEKRTWDIQTIIGSENIRILYTLYSMNFRQLDHVSRGVLLDIFLVEGL